MIWARMILLIIYFLPSITLSDESRNSAVDFTKCGKLYESGQFSQAAECYSQLILLKPYQAEIHFNLGNSYYRLNRIGEAVFHYRLAQNFLPRDYDLRANLDFVRNKIQEKNDTSESFSSLLKSATTWVTIRELGFSIGFFWLLFWAVRGCRLFLGPMRPSLFGLLTNASFTFFVFIGAILAAKIYWNQPFGVIVKDSVKVYSGAGFDNVLLFTLNNGIEFDIVDAISAEKGKWYRIRVDEKLEGWVHTDNVIDNTQL